MRKVNKVIMATVSILLSLVIASGSILSGVLARYTYSKGLNSQGAGFNKWGITVDAGSDVNSEYKNSDNTVMIKSNSHNVIAPGTKGSLAYFRVKADSPEVAYNIDVSGDITIGSGYTKSARIIRDSYGNALDYFPIILRCIAYDVTVVNGKNVLTAVDSLTSDPICLKRTDLKKNEHYFSMSAFESISAMESFMNGDFGIDSLLDDPVKPKNTSIDRVYSLEWEWLYHYDTVAEVDAGKTVNNREESAIGDYQTAELDTRLGEAILKNPGLFDITVNMSISVEQQLDETLYVRNGYKIEFGSYPQSKVTDTSLIDTLNSKAGTLPTASNSQLWTSYGYYRSGSNEEDFMWYIDVEDNGEKYRGVYFIAEKPNYNYQDRYPDSKDEIKYYQKRADYLIDTVYWFKYDPISWTIHEETSSGTAFILCDMLIDGQAYQNEHIGGSNVRWYNSSDGVSNGVYANNYEYSTIRKWLNETFYDTAFSELQKQVILTKVVDNRLETTGYPSGPKGHAEWYVCNNTWDKVFLLSTEDVDNEDYGIAKTRSVTEYAKAQGVWFNETTGCGYWWSRTFYCNTGGDYYNNSWYAVRYNDSGSDLRNYVTYNFIGVMPAMWIKL